MGWAPDHPCSLRIHCLLSLHLSKFWHLGAASGPFLCGVAHTAEPHSHTPSPGSSESHAHINTLEEWEETDRHNVNPCRLSVLLTTPTPTRPFLRSLPNTSSKMKVL